MRNVAVAMVLVGSFATLAASNARADDRTWPITFLSLVPKHGVAPTVASTLTAQLVQTARDFPALHIVDPPKIGKKPCAGIPCANKAAIAASTRFVVFGTAAKAGNKLLVNISLYDGTTRHVFAQQNTSLDGTAAPASYEPAMQTLFAALVDKVEEPTDATPPAETYSNMPTPKGKPKAKPKGKSRRHHH